MGFCGDQIAHGNALDVCAHGDDVSCGFMPKNARQRRPGLGPRVPVIDMDICATHQGGPQTDQDLMRVAAGDIHTGDVHAPLWVCLHDGKHRICGHSTVLSLLVDQGWQL